MRIIYERGPYRIVEIIDTNTSLELLKGDCFCPVVNTETDSQLLMREEKIFNNLVETEGVFGYTLEKWNPMIGIGWETVDSCWGFVGQHTDKNRHYIVDEFLSLIQKEGVES
jgi:hypothetical protein